MTLKGTELNTFDMARSAYSRPDAPTRTTRGTEYDLFARITHRLKHAASPETGGFAALAQAIHENRRLWSVLAADVAEEGNRLPDSLRARVFYLAEFTQQHSRKVLAQQASADVLIEVNSAIMAGLRQQGTPA
ncbi:MAG: flagellar biosynthesis regulator FlaF [Paracoccaceae bacterium]